MTTDHKFKLDVFEGPLDLLLHLIKANEMEISEISISKITSQYLHYLRLMESLDLEVAGDFLVMAATLLNIKLCSLLPEPETCEEEEAGDEDDFLTARALMQQLIEYRKFKEAAVALGHKAERQDRIFFRQIALPKLDEARQDPGITGDVEHLLNAFSRVLIFAARRDYHQIRDEEYHVSDKIELLRRRTLLEPRIRMQDVFGECTCRLEMVVSLIAVLELCRLRELRVIQEGTFDEILLVRADEAKAVMREEAEHLERIEADIVANRSGVVDDGQTGVENEEAELDRVLERPTNFETGDDPGAEPGSSRKDRAEDSNVIDISPSETRPSHTSEEKETP